MERVAIFVLLLVTLPIQKIYTAEIDIILDLQFLTENDTLVSPAGTFELGFLKPGSSEIRYLGIWYKKISVRTVVWVANRDLPLFVGSSGVLKIVHPGSLVLMSNNSIMWSSNTTSSGNAIAKLDDMGNLVMSDGDNKKIIWQSFDYPTDTILPGMKFGRVLLTGREQRLSSWIISEDPAPCGFTHNTDTHGEGSACLIWFGDLLDIRVITEGNGGQDIFVRMAFSELGGSLHVYEWQEKAMELPLFSFPTIAQSTASFSTDNKLGEDGFGLVYKGVLEGKEIAVKRLSTTSRQGLDEFKNEVICISKLQHRNLVKLLGCSIEGDEKLLIYEYLPNRSLDLFIFDKTQSKLLDWTKRLNIIKGITRGLLYLHQDS
ncbi:putative protein kinase RLK-Pelle-DLSV family [Helianthus anomalus]